MCFCDYRWVAKHLSVFDCLQDFVAEGLVFPARGYVGSKNKIIKCLNYAVSVSALQVVSIASLHCFSCTEGTSFR